MFYLMLQNYNFCYLVYVVFFEINLSFYGRNKLPARFKAPSIEY